MTTKKYAAYHNTFYGVTYRIRVSPFLDTAKEAWDWAEGRELDPNHVGPATNWAEKVAYDNSENPVWNNKSVAGEVLALKA